MRASDIMTTSVITVGPEATVRDIAVLLLEKRISAVPVVDAEGHIHGIVSEGDLMRRAEIGTERRRSWWLDLLAEDGRAAEYIKSHGSSVRDVMTPEVVTVAPDAELAEIADLLDRKHIKRVPVVDSDGKLVGIVSRANLLRALTVTAPPPAVEADDQRIRRELDQAFADAGLETHLLRMVVKDGAVKITGMVKSPEEKEAIRVATETVGGIASVDDQVMMVPDTFYQMY